MDNLRGMLDVREFDKMRNDLVIEMCIESERINLSILIVLSCGKGGWESFG